MGRMSGKNYPGLHSHDSQKGTAEHLTVSKILLCLWRGVIFRYTCNMIANTNTSDSSSLFRVERTCAAHCDGNRRAREMAGSLCLCKFHWRNRFLCVFSQIGLMVLQNKMKK